MSYTYFNISDKLRLYEFEGLLDQYGDATAAYSLRKLRNDYTGSAIRVRRSSDDAERDMGFYDNELDTVALLDWVNEDIVRYTSDFSSSGSTLGASQFTQTINETYNGKSEVLKAVWNGNTPSQLFQYNVLPLEIGSTYNISFEFYLDGFSRLRAGGNGNWAPINYTSGQWSTFNEIVTVNGVSDDLVIYPDQGSAGATIYLKNIVITQLTADGLVQTWYDQSANANHAVQNTDTAQPKIVDAGTLVTEGGKPAIIYDGVDDHFSDLSGVMGGSVNGLMLSVHKTNDGTTTPDVAQISSANPISIPIVGNNQVSYAHLTNTRRIFATSDNFYNRQILVSRQNYNSDHALYIDGDLIDSQTDTVNYTDVLKIGRVKAGATFLYFNNNMQELIVFNSNESTTRPDIETNINTYYSIY